MRQLRLQARQVVGDRQFALQEVAWQRAARVLAGWLARVADVGQRREASPSVNAQPGAAGLQIAVGEQPGAVRPFAQRLAGPGIEFVAIGQHQQGWDGRVARAKASRHMVELRASAPGKGLMADSRRWPGSLSMHRPSSEL